MSTSEAIARAAATSAVEIAMTETAPRTCPLASTGLTEAMDSAGGASTGSLGMGSAGAVVGEDDGAGVDAPLGGV